MSPAKSEKQRNLMCLALSMKKGKTPISASPEAAQIVNSMTMKEIEKFCGEPIKSK